MSGRFEFLPTPLAGLMIVKRRRAEDERGSFARLYCREEFERAGVLQPLSQINWSVNRHAGTVRGLHYQRPPHAETKLVSCMKGRIFDVAVDVRRGSPTFLRWHGETLSEENQRSLLIPEGFAHGFQTLTDHCEILYLHTAPYAAEAEGALNVADPALAIAWPLPIANLSERDRGHAMLSPGFVGVEVQK